MKQLILVFVGGGIGSIARFILAKYFNNIANQIPFGTLLANIIGSLLIGTIFGLALKSNSLTQNQILFLATGFCGGFTTFSSLTYESQILLKSGDFVHFFIYTTASFVLGLAAVFLGLYLVK